jgi:hypothetical protein
LNLIVDFQSFLLAPACDKVFFIGGADEAEAEVALDLHNLAGEPAAGQVKAVLEFLRFFVFELGKQLLISTLSKHHYVALPAGKKARLFLQANLENRRLSLHTSWDALRRQYAALHFLYCSIYNLQVLIS